MLTALPGPTSPAVQATAAEQKDSKKVDKITKNPLFWQYFNTSIQYDFNLDTSSATLFKCLKWMFACPQSRGFILTVPFEKEHLEFLRLHGATWKDMRKATPREQRKTKTRADYNTELDNAKKASIRKLLETSAIYFLENLIREDLALYSNKSIVLTTGQGYYSAEVTADPSLSQLLTSINSAICQELKLVPPGQTVANMSGLDTYMEFFRNKISLFSLEKIPRFILKKSNSSIDVAAASHLGDPNIILLNHLTFGASSGGRAPNLGKLSFEQMLAHEAGHNAASSFFHTPDKSGTYEYDNAGLQSSDGLQVRPTIDNTMGILQDPGNLTSIEVLP